MTLDPVERAARAESERDFCIRLLELAGHDDALSYVDEALALLCELVHARCGYLALGSPTSDKPRIAISRGLRADELDAVRQRLSHGIIGEALRTGNTIATASAMDDPRFATNTSVRAAKIEAVLCAPIGSTTKLGVVYLQGRDRPGPFGERERVLAELFAKHTAATIQRLLESHERQEQADPTLALRDKLQVESLKGRSPALASLFQHMHVASLVDVTTLILGESGTGKTHVARALHDSSRRCSGPFVELNCAAIPETLFESELFGVEKGAHSTATRRVLGKIDAARGGTLFLDEIGDLSLTSQAKLLQFIQSRSYFRLGSNEALSADVRLVAATNVDLLEAIAAKRFREDLFYRLEVFTLRVPALRERAMDIPTLAQALLAQHAVALGRTLTLSRAAELALAQASWPGNVRQLSSVMQRAGAVALSQDAEQVEISHVFPDYAGTSENPATQPAARDGLAWEPALRDFQRQYLERALTATAWNVTETARRTGLARSHLYELIRSHGLSRKPT
ncbi:MAG: sigma-54-dependent Fis family transcriptional regulator [Deltaproteobacteria bacterium]|nr:sigma-54-dependent Fis family transcriptional regulator [Deltaproteobacteria bacterium]